MKVAAWDGGSVEWEAHMREAGANKLSIDSWIMREGRAKKGFIVINGGHNDG